MDQRLNKWLGKYKEPLIIFLFALAVRVAMLVGYLGFLPFRGDEIVYARAGKLYINHFINGHLGLDQCLQYNYEHPMFAKLIYGFSILTLGPILGEAFAARLASALFGALTCAVVYSLGKKILGVKYGLLSSLTLCFSTFFLNYSVKNGVIQGAPANAVYLDAPCTLFMYLSILFLYKWIENSRYSIVPSGVFLGLATASKYFGFLTVPIALLWTVPFLKGRGRGNWKPLLLLIWVLIGAFTFLLVQPRMWHDPLDRLQETWRYNSEHMKSGHPIPISSFAGNGDWLGPRTDPPWWTIIYWLIIPSSIFEIVGLSTFIGMTVLGRIRITRENVLLIYLLTIPLLYFTVEPIKLPQYMTILVPGLSLLVGWGFVSFLETKRSIEWRILITVFFGLHVMYILYIAPWNIVTIKSPLMPFFYDTVNLLATVLLMISIFVYFKIRDRLLRKSLDPSINA